MVAKSKKAKVSKKQPSVSSYLANVPENVLLEIYSHLPMHQRIRGERVCRRFRNVLMTHAFRDVTKLEYTTLLKFKRKKQSGGKVAKTWSFIGIRALQQVFARCGRYLTEVDLGDFPERLIRHVLELCATCPRLSKINFSGTHSCYPAIVNLGNALETLTEVNFTGAAFGSFDSFEDSNLFEFFAKQPQRHWRFVDLSCSVGARTVLKHLTSIEALSLSGCHELRQEDVLSLKDGCPNLKELDISYNKDLLRDSDLQFDGWPSLEALWFNASHGDYYHQGHSLSFKDMPALKECHLRLNSFVNDQTLRTLCVAAPNLVVLDFYARSFSNHQRLSDHSLSCISNLRCLELLIMNYTQRFTGQHLMSVAVHGKLQYCDLGYCGQVGNKAIRYLLDTCKELTYLNVSNTSVDSKIAPRLFAYADEFEEDRSILQVAPGKRQLQNALSAHPNIICVPEGN